MEAREVQEYYRNQTARRRMIREAAERAYLNELSAADREGLGQAEAKERAWQMRERVRLAMEQAS